MMTHDDDDALTRPEVAQRLGVSVATLDRMRIAGKLPAPLRIGRGPRWLASDIAAWLRERRAGAAGDGAR